MSITSSITALGRPVAFYPAIARAFGDVNAALIVCQFMYWRGRVGEREIYKTQAEIESETFVPAHTQRRVLKRLSDLGMVTIEKKGVPARNHFLWHWDVVDSFISDYILQSQQNVTTSPNKLSPLDATNSHDQSRQIVTTITETTTETTADIINHAPPAARKNKTIPKPERVAEQIWNDFLEHRKAKKAPVTQTVIDSFQREADKAGISLEAAMIETMLRGWQGFKADWYFADLKKNSVGKESVHDRRAATAKAMFGDYYAGRIVDVSPGEDEQYRSAISEDGEFLR